MDYEWRANYTDNTYLEQFTNDEENRFGDIDLTKLDTFVVKSNQHTTQILVDVPKGNIYLNGTRIVFGNHNNRLIYFRRVRQSFGLSYMGNRSTFHMVGLQGTIEGKNRKLIFAIDDSTGGVEYFDN